MHPTAHCIRMREYQLTDVVVSLEIRFWSAITYILSLLTAGRHEIITKEILELDPADNVWTVVERRAAMPDSYDVCLVANLNPRELFTPWFISSWLWATAEEPECVGNNLLSLKPRTTSYDFLIWLDSWTSLVKCNHQQKFLTTKQQNWLVSLKMTHMTPNLSLLKVCFSLGNLIHLNKSRRLWSWLTETHVFCC